MFQSPVGFQAEQNQSDLAELETRNRELAALLAQHTQVNEQLTTQNEQIVRILFVDIWFTIIYNCTTKHLCTWLMQIVQILIRQLLQVPV